MPETYHVGLPLSNVVSEEVRGCYSGLFSLESEGKVKKSLESVCCACITLIDFPQHFSPVYSKPKCGGVFFFQS